jgi:hypothetical protein
MFRRNIASAAADLPLCSDGKEKNNSNLSKIARLGKKLLTSLPISPIVELQLPIVVLQSVNCGTTMSMIPNDLLSVFCGLLENIRTSNNQPHHKHSEIIYDQFKYKPTTKKSPKNIF